MQQQNFLHGVCDVLWTLGDNIIEVSTYFIEQTNFQRPVICRHCCICEITAVLFFSSPQNLSTGLSFVQASTHFLLHILLQLFGVSV